MEVNFNGDSVITGVAYTGKRLPSGVYDEKGKERHMIIDLSSLQIFEKMPILDDHGFSYRHLRESVIGLVDEIFIEDNQIEIGNATLFTSDNEAAQMIKSQSEKNIPYQMSIHWEEGEIFDAEKGDVINGVKLKKNDIVIKNALIRETTVTLFGRDSDTSVSFN
jgi:hypothetical protein